MNTFKFRINAPKKQVYNKDWFQICEISTKIPSIYYAVPFSPIDGVTREELIRLAIAELKVRMIQEIANAEFEEVNDEP